MVRKKIFVQPKETTMLAIVSTQPGDIRNFFNTPPPAGYSVNGDNHYVQVRTCPAQQLKTKGSDFLQGIPDSRLVMSGVFTDPAKLIYSLTEFSEYLPTNHRLSVIAAVDESITGYLRNPYFWEQHSHHGIMRALVLAAPHPDGFFETAKRLHALRHDITGWYMNTNTTWAELEENENSLAKRLTA